MADPEESPKLQEKVSTTDPDATWAIKSGPAVLGYYDNYLVDTASRVILSVDATPALFSQETFAARRMVEHVGQFGIHPQNLAADKAYGSGEFLAWPWLETFNRTSAHRSSSSDPGAFHTRPFSLRAKRECLLLPRRKSAALSRSSSAVAGAIFIARQKRNVVDVHKNSPATPVTAPEVV